MTDEKTNQVPQYPAIPPQPPYEAPQYTQAPPQQQYVAPPTMPVMTPQYGQGVGYSDGQQVADVTKQQQVPVGNGTWRNGLFGCTKSLPWCLVGCCLHGVLLARIADHTKKWDQIRPILILLVLLFTLGTISNELGHTARDPKLGVAALISGGVAGVCGLVSLVVLFIYIYKMCKLRGEIRSRYNINGSEMNDFLTTCCCTVCCCCSLHECQMFYEVADYEKMEIE